MNIEVLDLNDTSAPEAIPTGPAESLRALLLAPKPKDEAWQTDASRAVSMLAVRFLSESDDVLALHTVALVALAQSLGVKDARKRSLKLTRWAETAPPSFLQLSEKAEQHAALGALAKLTTPWSRSYAAEALAAPSLPEDFVPDLLKWARCTYADGLVFVHEFYAPRVAAASTGERAATLLKEAGKLLKPGEPEKVARSAEAIAVLVDALLQSAGSAVADDKGFTSGVTALLNLIEDFAAAAPAILLQPIFVMSFSRLSRGLPKGSATKQVTAVADALSLATISLLAADVERHGSRAAIHWAALVPTWRAAYVNWDVSMTAALKWAPAVAEISAGCREDENAGVDAYAAEAVFARLLPAWNAFVAELPDASRAASLTAMLQQAAGTLGIAPLGEQGSVVSYDPLAHHLAAETGGSPKQVRILRSGVQVQRPDGSTRVLVTALVAAE